MRDLALGLVLLVLCLGALRRPWIGVLAWTWISLMNPHAYSWQLNSMPVAAAVAVSTLTGLLYVKDRDFSLTPETVVLLTFMAWMCITLLFSFDISGSLPMWKRVMKIDFMVLVTLAVLVTKQRLMNFVWVVVGSIGFYGVKGGIFTLATGGNYRVWGPPTTFIEGNNELALALIVIAPLMYFLISQIGSKLGKLAITFAILMCVAASLGSHSRGALVALAAMVLAFWWYTNRRFWMLFLIILVGAIAAMFLPEHWFSRMNTIVEYQQDASALGRINAWWMAWNLARENFFGGGFAIYNAFAFSLYAPEPLDIHAAHSIYFQVLGEHGFVGLALFLLLWVVVWRRANRLRKDFRNSPDSKWLSNLGAMCQVSLVGYAVGGSFLSLAYFDLPYNILIIVVAAHRLLGEKEQSLSDDMIGRSPVFAERN